MGLYFRKRIPVGKRGAINLSRRGASGTVRLGRLSLNTRGRTTVRLGKGLTWRGGCAVLLLAPVALGAAGVAATVLAVR